MRATYFDEVKSDLKANQPFYVIGGISLPVERIPTVEALVDKLSGEVFGSSELSAETEFHSAHIYFAKGRFKGWDPRHRIEILIGLAEILHESDAARRVYAAVNTLKLKIQSRAPDVAFQFFCERVQLLVQPEVTLLIGDLDRERSAGMINQFLRYRANGTPWRYGTEITQIVDCVHFAHSHHSRMLQLADAYLFLMMHLRGGRSGWMAQELSKGLSKFNLFPHRYKEWPRD